MDPEETARIMQDRNEESAVRIEAAENLLAWVRRGGFCPSGWRLLTTRWMCNEMVADAMRRQRMV